MQKILVANRGEIALRIMRTLKEMNIKSVAVFSEADRNAPFVRYADEAYCIGPAPSNQSYLKGATIIETALKCGAQGIHPGYGFLSENAEFARAVKNAGLLFIGPPADSMDRMGDKLRAKATAKAQQVPMIPGSEGAISDFNEALEVARSIGFPLLIKASAGGGGKGMRLVQEASELEEQMRRAISEAESAFGNGAVFIERYASGPRHIEIQVLADQHGHAVYLFERECSIQRRHQKLIEEAPSCVLSPELRAEMGQCAVRIAQSCGYTGAGTVEFLLDDQNRFYFLEMNTRLQVEHPVTELITGVDLVREQVEIARGKPLRFNQSDLEIRGHAIEIRVCAEDPKNQFLPDIGHLHVYKPPMGPGIRVDDGFEEHMDIPIYYDPMISKLIVHAENRETAIARMLRAISDYTIIGVETTLEFCAFALKHPAFQSGKFDTGFVAAYFKPELLQSSSSDSVSDEAAVIAAAEGFKPNVPQGVSKNTSSRWKQRR